MPLEPHPSGLLDTLEARHRALQTVRRFFEQRRFVEVETPAVVRAPGIEPHLDAFEVGERHWLNTSPEYHMKRLLVLGMPRIYQLCRAFRRDEQGQLHEPEFTLLEWYRADAGSVEVMRDTEELVAAVAAELCGSSRVPALNGPVDVSPPWPRVTVASAFAEYAGVQPEQIEDDDTFFRLLVTKVEPLLGRGRPTFLTHYPARMASLARLDPLDPRFADRFECYLDGVELCNGFGELTDALEQRRRLERAQEARQARNADAYPIDERFLAALEQGMPDSGGNALGLDRLLMLVLGAKRVGDVMAFPAERL